MIESSISPTTATPIENEQAATGTTTGAKPSHMIDALDLGIESLASLISVSLDGFAVADMQGRLVYANAAAYQIYGYSAEELTGQNFLTNIAERDRPALTVIYEDLLRGVSSRGQVNIVRPNGEERTIDLSSMVLRGAQGTYLASIFRDISERRRLEREGAALIEIASRVAFGGSLNDTLHELCRHLVGVTGAVASAVVLLDRESGQLRMVGEHGLSPGYLEAANKLIAAGVRVVSVEALERRQPIVRRNVRANLAQQDSHVSMQGFLRVAEWDTIVAVPMNYRDEAVGTLLSYYSPTHNISDDQLNFHIAIANQAAVAVENARLLSQVQEKAALEERARLARELHDSVSQALFSISLQARSARILLDRDPSRLQEPLDEVLGLSRSALAEMRALLLALRPGALHEEGLVEALRKHGAGVAAREKLLVDVIGPAAGLPQMRVEAEEALYRIVQEALHNVVKHAQAGQVQITIELNGDTLAVRVTDNGIGFHTEQVATGRMGLGTMRQRTDSLGGEYRIESAPGRGTTVLVSLPATSWRPAE